MDRYMERYMEISYCIELRDKNGKKHRISGHAKDKFNIQPENLLINITPAFLFVIEYINFYDRIEEPPVPNPPLSNYKDLKDIFKFEYTLFGPLLYNMNNMNNVAYLCDIMQISHRLKLHILSQKLAIVMAWILTNTTNPKIKVLKYKFL
jgi:hypothetical protein